MCWLFLNRQHMLAGTHCMLKLISIGYINVCSICYSLVDSWWECCVLEVLKVTICSKCWNVCTSVCHFINTNWDTVYDSWWFEARFELSCPLASSLVITLDFHTVKLELYHISQNPSIFLLCYILPVSGGLKLSLVITMSNCLSDCPPHSYIKDTCTVDSSAFHILAIQPQHSLVTS